MNRGANQSYSSDMYDVSRIIAAAGLVLIAGCQARPEQEMGGTETPSGKLNPILVGRWEPVEKSRGGIGAVMDMFDDGTFVSGLVVQVDGRFSFDGKRLSCLVAPDKKVMENLPVEFIGNSMIIEGEPVRERVGARGNGEGPIVGVWTYEHHTGAPAYERYVDDGTVQLRIPVPGEARGRFAVTDGTLTMETLGGGADVNAFTVSGDLLTLSREGGRARVLRRTSAWYAFPMSAADAERLRARVLRR